MTTAKRYEKSRSEVLNAVYQWLDSLERDDIPTLTPAAQTLRNAAIQHRNNAVDHVNELIGTMNPRQGPR